MSAVFRWSRIGFVVAAWLFAAAVVVQVFLAGLSTFDTPEYWADHVTFGRWSGVLTIFIVAFAVVGRFSKLIIALSVLVFFLYGMQFPFANTDAAFMAALHPVNALVLFWLSVQLGQRARPLAFAPSP